jgi:CTP:molybdopterin cytidylyltransferase MocA
MIEIKKEFSAIILAAGKSERLGFPKLSLKYDDKKIFIEHVVNEYLEFSCTEIILVLNEIGNKYLIDNQIRFNENVKIIINEHPDWHRFYSLKIGARSLNNIHAVFVHNVDNPFVNIKVLKELINCSEKADYLSPEYEGKGGHPFLISKNIVQELRSIEENQMHLKEFLNQFFKMKVKVDDEKVLVNINTLEEYEKYF